MRGRFTPLALAFSFCSRARCVATATLMGFPSLKRSSGLWGKPIRTAAINFDKVELNYRGRLLSSSPSRGRVLSILVFLVIRGRGKSKI